LHFPVAVTVTPSPAVSLTVAPLTAVPPRAACAIATLSEGTGVVLAPKELKVSSAPTYRVLLPLPESEAKGGEEEVEPHATNTSMAAISICSRRCIAMSVAGRDLFVNWVADTGLRSWSMG